MKIKKKLFHKEFNREKLSLCGQYGNKYERFVNIEDSLFVIHKNMEEIVLNIIELYRMWNMII